MPWSTVIGNVLLPFRLAGRVGPAAARARRRRDPGGRARRVRARLSASAFGRDADAGLDRPRAGHRPRPVAARRALCRARRDHPDGAQRRSDAVVGQPPADGRVCHAQRLRIGLSVDPDRGDDRRGRGGSRPSWRSTCRSRANAHCVPRPPTPRSAPRFRPSRRGDGGRRRDQAGTAGTLVADRGASRGGRGASRRCGRRWSGSRTSQLYILPGPLAIAQALLTDGAQPVGFAAGNPARYAGGAGCGGDPRRRHRALVLAVAAP